MAAADEVGRALVGRAPNSTPRSRKGELTRARILEAAKAVFEESGFRDARISDISERAGLSHGSFYHYFDSKEQVFRLVAETAEKRLAAPPDDERLASSPAHSTRERIRRANRRYLERYRDESKILRVVEEVSHYDPHVSHARISSQKYFSERTERLIRQLQAEGRADPTLDPRFTAFALGAMVVRVADLWLLQGYFDFYDFDEAVEQLTRIWANVLGLDGDQRDPPSGRAATD